MTAPAKEALSAASIAGWRVAHGARREIGWLRTKRRRRQRPAPQGGFRMFWAIKVRESPDSARVAPIARKGESARTFSPRMFPARLALEGANREAEDHNSLCWRRSRARAVWRSNGRAA